MRSGPILLQGRTEIDTMLLSTKLSELLSQNVHGDLYQRILSVDMIVVLYRT